MTFTPASETEDLVGHFTRATVVRHETSLGLARDQDVRRERIEYFALLKQRGSDK